MFAISRGGGFAKSGVNVLSPVFGTATTPLSPLLLASKPYTDMNDGNWLWYACGPAATGIFGSLVSEGCRLLGKNGICRSASNLEGNGYAPGIAGRSGDGGLDFVTAVKDLFKDGLLASCLQGSDTILRSGKEEFEKEVGLLPFDKMQQAKTDQDRDL